MDDGYYLPEMEEFHVGFEYEEFVKHEGWVSRKVQSVSEDITLNKNNYCIDFPEDFRVKYLDDDDIELLGWKLIPDTTLPPNKLYEKPYKDERGFADKITLIYNHESHWALITEGGDEVSHEDELTRFCGFIKNKSELKKLMKQLQIEVT